MSESVYYSFYPQGRWAGENFEFVLNSFISQIPGWSSCPVSVLHVVITLTDLGIQIGVVRFFSLLNVKQSPNLVWEIQTFSQNFNIPFLKAYFFNKHFFHLST